MKIAHIATVDMSLRHLLLNQLRSLQDLGYEVAGISSPGPDVAHVEQEGVRHIAVRMSRRFTPLKDLLSLVKLVRVMRREQFDIVHTHTPKPGLLGQMAAWIAGVPIIVNTLHGFYFHERSRPLSRRFYVAIEKLSARFSDLILCQNPEDLQTAIVEGICQPDRIRLLGNGIDLRRFDGRLITPDVRKKTRTSLGIMPGQRVVGFVGRLVEEKGVLELLQAARIVCEHDPSVRFLFVGIVDSEKADSLSVGDLRQLGPAGACLFPGKRLDMPEVYSVMDVFVLPSHREGYPRSLMEASAMGVPSIATQIRGCRQVVRHMENGLLVPVGDVRSIADQIMFLLAHPELCTSMSKAARKIAEESFDERRVFDIVASEYERIIAVKGLHPPDRPT